MQNLSRSILGLRRRVCFASPSLWNSAFVGRKKLVMDNLDPLSRLQHSPRVGCEKKQGKLHSLSTLARTTNTSCVDTEKMKNKATKEATDNNPVANDIWFPNVCKDSSHRDGAIYKNWIFQGEWSDVDITDRRETRVEPMHFWRATEECTPGPENCRWHYPEDMLQFFSLTLVKTPISKGSVQLYGYIAVRDERDWMLNYIFNRRRDDPIIVQQGHDIEMTGPKRGIEMSSPVLIEFDMRIKNGELEQHDLEVVDGALSCDEDGPSEPIKYRISGRFGTVDISLAFVPFAVEATIEVFISEVHSPLSLSISSLIYIMENYEEIQQFHGTVEHSCGLRRFVVAVTVGTEMFLRFKVGNHVERLSFEPMQHGYQSEHTKFDVASVAVKVTWSAIESRCKYA